MHELCQRCHRTPPPRYPTARRYPACRDCHAARPEPVYLVGDHHRLALSVQVTGGFPDPDDLQRTLADRFREDEFVLVDPSTADATLDLRFHLIEVHDPIVPRGSGVRLFQGSCEIRLDQGKHRRMDLTLRSRVVSRARMDTAAREIAPFLLARAYRVAAAGLEAIVFGEPIPVVGPGLTEATPFQVWRTRLREPAARRP